MTITLGWLENQRFTLVTHKTPLPVFVRDMPHPRSSAHQAHIGLAEMVATLMPVLPARRPLAAVRLPGGTVRHVDMDAICNPTNVAPIRLGPGIHGQRKGAAA